MEFFDDCVMAESRWGLVRKFCINDIVRCYLNEAKLSWRDFVRLRNARSICIELRNNASVCFDAGLYGDQAISYLVRWLRGAVSKNKLDGVLGEESRNIVFVLDDVAGQQYKRGLLIATLIYFFAIVFAVILFQ